MIYDESSINTAPEYAYVDGCNGKMPSSITGFGAGAPTLERLMSYSFKQRIFGLSDGKCVLKLNEYPLLFVDSQTMEFEVKGWGIKMPCSKAAELPREICRTFLFLFGKSEEQTLSDNESERWLSILDQIDFDEFSIGRAPPRYHEGQLVHHEPKCMVTWHDGKRQSLSDDVASSLSLLNPGERFSAYVKLGKNDEVLEIERVVLLATTQSRVG
jgi:hypothetical protein